MAESFFDRVHKQDTHTPDVLACLANLSNDEVFTPPEVVNQMLDMLPKELFESTETTFLDPACKTGVFLREIAKRLLNNQVPLYKEKMELISEKKSLGIPLKPEDEEFMEMLQAAIDHIFHKQLFGIAITELTSLLSRRSVYCSKYPNGQYSISHFDNPEGNIRFRKVQHTWVNGKCKYCGASQSEYDRSPDKETHAYEFIHMINLQEAFKMPFFDVIISNPPYQLSDGGGGAGKSAKPIYHLFVEQSKKLNPHYISMIIPSRWFSGGKGLDEFRNNMLSDDRLSVIVDYADSKACFANGVDIPGGICYFLWNKDRKGLCSVTNVLKDGRRLTAERKLNEYETFVRNNSALSIVNKALSKNEITLSKQVSSRKPFGLESNTEFDEDGDVILRSSKGTGKIKHNRILSGNEMIHLWKVIVSKVSFEHAGVPDKDGMMRVLSVLQVLPPNSACTESYLVAGAFNDESEAKNLISYLKTKFVRFLIMQMLASMNMSKSSYSFVPIQDFSKQWTDEELYAKYGLTDDEIAFIESMIRPMEID